MGLLGNTISGSCEPHVAGAGNQTGALFKSSNYPLLLSYFSHPILHFNNNNASYSFLEKISLPSNNLCKLQVLSSLPPKCLARFVPNQTPHIPLSHISYDFKRQSLVVSAIADCLPHSCPQTSHHGIPNNICIHHSRRNCPTH